MSWLSFTDNSDWALSPVICGPSGRYAPTHDVAPSAVSIAVAIDAISCTINFAVSFFVMIILLSWFKQGLQF